MKAALRDPAERSQQLREDATARVVAADGIAFQLEYALDVDS
jgi:hypothetical protein